MLGTRRSFVVYEFLRDFSGRTRRIESLSGEVGQRAIVARIESGKLLVEQVQALTQSWGRVMDNLEDHQAEATLELMATTDPLSLELLSATVPEYLHETKQMELMATRQYERIRRLSISMIVLVFLGAYVTALILISHIMGALREKRMLAENLREAMLKAESASRAKSSFLSNMSHELRTPMNGVIGMANVLASMPLPGNQRTMVDVLKTSADTALSLINDILDFEAIEAGKVTLESRTFALGSIVERIERLAMAQLVDKPITFRVYQHPDVPRLLEGDEDRLIQILTNLISNAIKFTEQGQVGLEISMAPDGNLQFAIDDTGIGIEADGLDALFDAFRQGDDSIRRRYGGTGLGLSITRNLVHMMRGSIVAESKPGSGSTFSVFLPLQKATMLPIAEEMPEVTETGSGSGQDDVHQGRTVLCVDDNPINIEVARYLLEEVGMAFHSANCGEEALEVLDVRPVDVVLMDCHMEGMDGFQTTSRILERFPQLPVLALTADATLQTHRRCEETGMRGLVTKPFHPEKLYQAIQMAMSHEPEFSGYGEVTASGVSSKRA